MATFVITSAMDKALRNSAILITKKLPIIINIKPLPNAGMIKYKPFFYKFLLWFEIKTPPPIQVAKIALVENPLLPIAYSLIFLIPLL